MNFEPFMITLAGWSLILIGSCLVSPEILLLLKMGLTYKNDIVKSIQNKRNTPSPKSSAPIRKKNHDKHQPEKLILRVDDYGNIDFEYFSSVIAHNIFLNCTKNDSETVATEIPLDVQKNPGKKINTIEDLNFHSWIQIFVQEKWIKVLSIEREAIQKKLIIIFENAPNHIETSIVKDYTPIIDIFCETNSLKIKSSEFALSLQPILEHTPDNIVECDAYILIEDGGTINLPGCQNRLFTVDNTFKKRSNIYPLCTALGNTLTIGPENWCHIMTDRNILDNPIEIAWSKPTDLNAVGKIELLSPKCPKNIFIIDNDDNDSEFNTSNSDHTFYKTNDIYSKCNLEKRNEGNKYKIARFYFKNPSFQLKTNELPDCIVYSGTHTLFESKIMFAKFIATQIYIMSKELKVLSDNVILLDDSEWGTTFNIDPERSPIETIELSCMVRLCLPENKKLQFQELFNKGSFSNEIHEQILNLFKESDIYQKAFEKVTTNLQENFFVNLFFEKVIPDNNILIRLLPTFRANLREKIYGKIDLENWQDMLDISLMSIEPRKTAFFLDYPSGIIRCRISCYPVYGLYAQDIKGILTIQVLTINYEKEIIIENNTNQSFYISDGKEIEAQTSERLLFSQIKDCSSDYKYFDLSPDKLRSKYITIKIYNEPNESYNEKDFRPRPGSLSLYGLTLSKKMDRNNWNRNGSSFYEIINKIGLKTNQIEGVGQATENGYLAVVETDDAKEEVHFFAGDETEVRFDDQSKIIYSNQSTFNMNQSKKISYIKEVGFSDIKYIDIDIQSAKYKDILLSEHEEFFYQYGDPSEIEGQIIRVDLLRCDPKELYNPEKHLYYILTENKGGRWGYFFHLEKGIKEVGICGSSTFRIETDKTLVGPINANSKGLFWISWSGEKKTMFSFDIDDHITQFERYLANGFYSISSNIMYHEGGCFTSKKFKQAGYIAKKQITSDIDFKINNFDRRYLSFEPREYVDYYDKDSFSIEYNPKEGKFVVISRCHSKQTITPKTVFMVVPNGGKPCLGSHAIPYVPLEQGENYIVLPGLTFLFTYGTNYYIN